jgi:parallel beta-helix repeat protein
VWEREDREATVGRLTRRLVSTALAPSLVVTSIVASAVAGIAGGPGAAYADGTTRYVATTGSDTANTCLVLASPCLTLGHALSQATFDNTIELSPGTYLVSDNPTGTANAVPSTMHDLIIESNPSGGTAANTIIDATDEPNGLVVNADNVTVRNLTFRHADLDGIVVAPPEDAVGPVTVGNLTLTGDVVTTNDLCSQHPAAAGCPVQHSAPLPFGEGISLTSVVDSTVTGNTVTGNWGGIAVGAAVGDTISGNTVSGNGTQPVLGGSTPLVGGNRFAASGITLTGGSGSLATHGNTITGNTVDANGSVGIFVHAGGGQGDAAYGNHVTGNTVNDNWGVGIAVKSYAPLQNVGGNVITGNHVSHDGLHGAFAAAGLGGPGDTDADVTHTTGILVLSATETPLDAAPVTGTVITGNTIADVFYGVWMSVRTPKADVSANTTSVDAGGAPILVERRSIAPILGVARTPSGHGYWEVQSDGTVFPFGDAGYFGSLGGLALAAPVVGIAATASGAGYWLVASDGGIFAFGDAGFHGSAGALRLNRPIVGMAAGPSGNGYWLVASDGGIFSYGTAAFHGSAGALRLNRPIVGMAAGPSGNGYWLVASDGGIFSYGTARFHGSTGAIRLNQPMTGMAAEPSGTGYWLVASDGGVFSYGSARFHGSTGAIRLNQPVVGVAATTTGLGYWLAARDGGIFAFPDARYFGSEPANS